MERDGHLLELCRGYLDAQSLVAESRRTALHPLEQQPAITLSRETGAGAVTIARMAAERLQTGSSQPWAVFDRNLVQKTLEGRGGAPRGGRGGPGGARA